MKEPQALQELLERLVAGLGPENAMETARLFGAWDQIVGPEVSGRCTPTSLKKGVLKVQTDSAAWAGEFRYLAPQVIRRINQKLGSEVVCKIEPWVPAAGGRESKKLPPAAAKSAPRQPAAVPNRDDLEEAGELTDGIADQRLAEATKRALLAGKMRQKGG